MKNLIFSRLLGVKIPLVSATQPPA